MKNVKRETKFRSTQKNRVCLVSLSSGTHDASPCTLKRVASDPNIVIDKAMTLK